jgi:hypothetical protein
MRRDVSMATGIHWEWRAFGVAPSDFAQRYGELEALFPPKDFEDVYLWAPGLRVNVKVRDYAREPFKFKRLRGKHGNLEQWSENREDIFEFPLKEAAWDALGGVFAEFNVALGPYPSKGADRETVLTRLKAAGAQTVEVSKRRQSRLWTGPHGAVIVEWARISAPQVVDSIGLETWEGDQGGEGLSDEQAQEDIVAALEALGLPGPLKPMNYLDALAVWASGGKL